jgi:demethylmenaquinone methyltransferase/2-methoxy-6-polyprenyl-1,4-benzoquinol methylase
MSPAPPSADPERFEPHAVRPLATMFDRVTGRYDLLNRIMTLGRDDAWRRVMWGAVPGEARVVLDLCTGSGASLSGLRRPGRLVLGLDASLGMLGIAADRHGTAGWSPRLACADAFHLPLRDGSLDAVTLAFGMRNLRPRSTALAELARVLRPGGTLVVLEATAPEPGPLAPLHSFYLRRLLPLLGRLSSDPSAYSYLGRSVFEFGAGAEFEHDLAGAGFELVRRHSFFFGAARLWVVRRAGAVGQNPTRGGPELQNARWEGEDRGDFTQTPSSVAAEWRTWTGAQLAVSAVLFAALLYGLWAFLNSRADLPLEPWQSRLGLGLLAVSVLGFGIRTWVLLLRFLGPPPQR